MAKDVAYLYDELLKKITVDNTFDEIGFYDQDLEKEYLNSTNDATFFGTRRPPLETGTFLNIFKIVLDNVDLPPSFPTDHDAQRLYRDLCLYYYTREYEKYTKMRNVPAPADAPIDDDKPIIPATNDRLTDDNIARQNLKRLIVRVFEAIDENDAQQNVWYYSKNHRKISDISDEDLNHFIYVCIHNNDPSLLYRDYMKTYALESRTASMVIYLVYFCYYKLLLPYIVVDNDAGENSNQTLFKI